MPAYDNCEPQIINALQKDGWRIISKPYMIRTNKHTAYADFSMQRGVNGRTEQIIVLEVKCFANPKTDLQELYTAIGQYGFYREVLRKKQRPLPLYLALPDSAYERLISDLNIKALLKDASVKMVIVNLEQEEIVEWIT